MDSVFVLEFALAGALIAGVVLTVMSLGVEDRAADKARGHGLYDTSGSMDPLGRGDLPLHYKFFHPATTAHWNRRGLLPLLTSARVVFAASLALGLGTLMWLAA